MNRYFPFSLSINFWYFFPQIKTSLLLRRQFAAVRPSTSLRRRSAAASLPHRTPASSVTVSFSSKTIPGLIYYSCSFFFFGQIVLCFVMISIVYALIWFSLSWRSIRNNRSSICVCCCLYLNFMVCLIEFCWLYFHLVVRKRMEDVLMIQYWKYILILNMYWREIIRWGT